jgi:hypothetical protein
MDGKILEEFDIEAPKLVYAMASRPFVLKYKGKSAWDREYKKLCNAVRIGCRLGNKAVCLSTLSSKVDGMLCADTLHVTVLDYDIGDDEHFFLKADLDTGEFSISEKNLDDEFLDSMGDDKMSRGRILQPIRQTTISDPYIVQMLLSEPYIIAKKGRSDWSYKYIKACMDVQTRLAESDVVEWHEGMVVVGALCNEDGIVDYKKLNVCQFDCELTSHMTYSVNQDGNGKMELVLEVEEEAMLDESREVDEGVQEPVN